jgi:hypothetical protein
MTRTKTLIVILFSFLTVVGCESKYIEPVPPKVTVNANPYEKEYAQSEVQQIKQTINKNLQEAEAQLKDKLSFLPAKEVEEVKMLLANLRLKSRLLDGYRIKQIDRDIIVHSSPEKLIDSLCEESYLYLEGKINPTQRRSELWIKENDCTSKETISEIWIMKSGKVVHFMYKKSEKGLLVECLLNRDILGSTCSFSSELFHDNQLKRDYQILIDPTEDVPNEK